MWISRSFGRASNSIMSVQHCRYCYLYCSASIYIFIKNKFSFENKPNALLCIVQRLAVAFVRSQHSSCILLLLLLLFLEFCRRAIGWGTMKRQKTKKQKNFCILPRNICRQPHHTLSTTNTHLNSSTNTPIRVFYLLARSIVRSFALTVCRPQTTTSIYRMQKK